MPSDFPFLQALRARQVIFPEPILIPLHALAVRAVHAHLTKVSGESVPSLSLDLPMSSLNKSKTMLHKLRRFCHAAGIGLGFHSQGESKALYS